MENPFKKIINDEKLPEVIKQKVMDDVALIKLSFDLADLFAIKYPSSLNEILNITKKDNNQNHH